MDGALDAPDAHDWPSRAVLKSDWSADSNAEHQVAQEPKANGGIILVEPGLESVGSRLPVCTAPSEDGAERERKPGSDGAAEEEQRPAVAAAAAWGQKRSARPWPRLDLTGAGLDPAEPDRRKCST